MNHYSYFSNEAKKHKMPVLIKTRKKLETWKQSIDLAAGKPNPDFFPLTEAALTLQDGKVLHISQDQINVGLQYSLPDGITQLVDHLAAMIKELFAPPHMDQRKVMVTAGANAANYIIMNTFVNPGDYVFIPEVTYPTVHNLLRCAEARMVPIPSDDGGMRSDKLREALEKSSDGRRKLLYVVPHGDNPTGNTMREDRMREIYSLACEYDLLILEDDPYYFLQYDLQVPLAFLSLDTEGRVIRVDSFSKTVGAGMRLGYITADQPFVEQLTTKHALIMSHPTSFSQVVTYELLRTLGHKGFIEMNKNTAKKYKQLRDAALQAATKHLTGLCEWKEPDGMFLWLKVLGLKDATEVVTKGCLKRGVVLVPGCNFKIDSSEPSPYIRVSFSMTTPESADKALQVLAEAIREELKKTASEN